MRPYRFLRNDCRTVIDPIDYIIHGFEGLRMKGKVSRMFFASYVNPEECIFWGPCEIARDAQKQSSQG
jgi:hypothetical protein